MFTILNTLLLITSRMVRLISLSAALMQQLICIFTFISLIFFSARVMEYICNFIYFNWHLERFLQAYFVIRIVLLLTSKGSSVFTLLVGSITSTFSGLHRPLQDYPAKSRTICLDLFLHLTDAGVSQCPPPFYWESIEQFSFSCLPTFDL